MCRPKPVCASAFHVVEHHMNIDWLAFDRPLVGEHLHAVD